MPSDQKLTSEADPLSIHELFQADPESLNDQDISRIVDHYREKRNLFLVEENKKKARGSSKGSKDMPDTIDIEELLK